ncbi:MAG TPA: AAA family ATPase [Anaerolineaceae bacterium]|nr:AAA family ATPase [Anaerolineaceae bacterium]
MLPDIKHVAISNFRGIQKVDISFDKRRNLLIVGENGTGKSSIVDALEFFFTLGIEKLSGREDVSLPDCIPFSASNQDGCWVELRFDTIADPVRATFVPSTGKGKSRRTPNSSLEPYISKTHTFILHRSQLTSFIESRASDRYNHISDLIGLTGLDEVVKAWNHERSDREKEKKAAASAFQTINNSLSDFLGCPISTSDDITHAVNNYLANQGVSPITDLTEIETLHNQLAASTQNPNTALADQHRSFVGQIKELQTQWQVLMDRYNRLHADWHTYQEKAACLCDAAFVNIVQQGRQLITEQNLDACPVCEQPIERETLLTRLAARETELTDLIASNAQLKDSRDQAKLELTVCQRSWDALVKQARTLNLASAGDQESLKIFDGLNQDLMGEPFSLHAPEFWSSHPEIQIIQDWLQKLKDRAEENLLKLTPNETERQKAEQAYFLGQVSEKWKQWMTASQRYARAEADFNRVDHLYTALTNARQVGVEQIIAGLEKDFIKLYEQLHPGEGHRAIHISLKPGTASAKLETETDGLTVMHPLGNYSEGHLDSLGLCIFLAFIKHFSSDFPLIVLDDVLTSIDAGHRMKVAQLLAKEFKEHQIIITTHDELWANELDLVMKKYHISPLRLQMGSWSKVRGATIAEGDSWDWELYRQQIARGRRQDTIGSIGRHLEKFLYRMRQNLHLAISATYGDRYTIGDLAPAFWKWVEDHPFTRPDIPDLTNKLRALHDEFDFYWKFRNWSGAHYNDWGAAVSASEANSFLEIAQELIGYFECPACGDWVQYDAGNQLLRCPVCEPAVAAKAIWQYKPDWIKPIERMRLLPNFFGKLDSHVLAKCKLTLEQLLNDARIKFHLSVAPQMDDTYRPPDLYTAMCQQLQKFPNSRVPDWQARLDEFDQRLKLYVSPELVWKNDNDLLPDVITIYETIRSLTDLLGCPECGELFNLDCTTGTYHCPKCEAESEKSTASPAAWPVMKK